jgi:hypothetical protein
VTSAALRVVAGAILAAGIYELVLQRFRGAGEFRGKGFFRF